MMKRILDKHEWAVDLAAAVLCASALAQAYTLLQGRRDAAPVGVVVASAETSPRHPDQLVVRKLGERSYEIEAARGSLVFDGLPSLSRSARIVPELREGRPAGFRLFSVRADGPLARLGFENGDVLRAIDGREFSTPEQALELYARLKSARAFTVSFERDGQPLTNEYRLR